MDATPEERRALFRVVRGAPADDELAALTVVLAAAAAAGADAPEPRRRDHWSDPAARMRTTLTPGPGAWQRRFGPS
jgi:hypothetical protein